MKKVFLFAVASIALLSCSEKKGWTETEKDTFVKNCIPEAQRSTNIDETAAKDYCNCMLDKIVKKYPDTKAAAAFNAQEATEMAKDCVKK